MERGRTRRSLNRNNLDARRVAEFAEKLFAIFPSKSESAHISDTEAGYDCGQGFRVHFCKFIVH